MDTVKTRTGELEGFVTENGVRAFLGIPYAQQPVGALRWKAPQPLHDSDELIECKKFGHTAVQIWDEVELASQTPQGEDCLKLNVWVKDPEKKKQPVMVYIHGGAYFSGGPNDPLYNGANFAARKDVVLVSIGYRLNIFGSLYLKALPGGDEYPDAGHLAIMDQAAALTWIKENIAAFGGDPDNVTLFGESAGSASIALLSVAPAASGLFQKAICESGPIQLYKTPKFGELYAKDFAKMLGCTTAQELAEKSTEDLLHAVEDMCERRRFEVSLMYSPVCDGAYLPAKPMKAWKDGAASDITFMMGSTGDEFKYFSFYFTPEETPDFWHGQFNIHFDGQEDPKKWEKVYEEAYPERDLIDNYIDFMNNTGFFVGCDLMAEEQSKFGDVFVYRFDYKSKIEGMGACHAIEIPFVLENLDTPDGLSFTGENPPQELADKMNDTWYAFAKTGNPSTAELGDWPLYTAQEHVTMYIDDKTWEPHLDINEKNLKIFTPMYECLLSD